ncbi:MAG: cold shock domain-containing protein [Candidatus Nanohaloarchaeota archaeon QJJ-9]|nr:cold shock domain-containing protein [Candidatus Nanohaloarchaeota archaeon QJJ-9]
MKVLKGEVAFFHDVKKYGFIQPEDADEDEDDLFFHISDVDGEEIQEGDDVEFETEESEDGPKAANVEVL